MKSSVGFPWFNLCRKHGWTFKTSRLNQVKRWFNLNVLVCFQTCFRWKKVKWAKKSDFLKIQVWPQSNLGITPGFGGGYTNHASCVQRGHKPPKSEGLKVGSTCCFGQNLWKWWFNLSKCKVKPQNRGWLYHSGGLCPKPKVTDVLKSWFDLKIVGSTCWNAKLNLVWLHHKHGLWILRTFEQPCRK